MHVPHHMPAAAEPQVRVALRRPPEKEEAGPYARISDQSEKNQGQNSKSAHRRQRESDAHATQPPQDLRPAKASALAAAPASVPFMTVTRVTQFWTELVMAGHPADGDGIAATAGREGGQNQPSLLDLFAMAAK